MPRYVVERILPDRLQIPIITNGGAGVSAPSLSATPRRG